MIGLFNPVRLVLIGSFITLLAAAFWGYGYLQYREGKREMAAEIAKARAASVEEAERIEKDVEALSDDELLDAVLNYVRP